MDTNQTDTMDHAGNFIYRNNSLKIILVEGGYIEDGNYYFYITDHLGNNRIVADASGDVVQSNEYYPFGLLMATSTEADKQPYKYGNKELDSYNGLNLYDFEARYLDSGVPGFTTQDPLAEKYYSISPYVYVGNNPLRYVDPTGMSPDWFQNKSGMMQYDPNITKDSKLQEGETYIGTTHQVTDSKGNILENYRKDGSIMYNKESSAYTRLITRSERTGNETMAVLTNKGTLVLPDYKNNSSTVDLKDYGYSTKNRNIVDASGIEHNTLGTVHTHPDGGGPSTYTVTGYGDLGFAAYATPYKPVYVLQLNGKNSVSFVVSPFKDFKNAANINLTKQYPGANIKNLQNGKFSLMQFTKSNNFRKILHP